MDLPFIKQVCLEIIRGGFILLGVTVGGGYASRALEKYKSQQAINSDLRKRQYDALGVLLDALAKLEHDATNLCVTAKITAGECEKDGKECEERRNNLHQRSLELVNAFQAVCTAQSFFVGASVAKMAHEFAEELFCQMFTSIEEPETDDEAATTKHRKRLDNLRQPLQELLPIFKKAV